ncbi:MAG: hypothetical protein Q4C75_06375 [Bergeyella zoohelcum]|nr:hypothetical protein [Bergeyella zoohelcum]
MALPRIASVFDMDIPNANFVMSEEETHSTSSNLLEKTLPKVLEVADFIAFYSTISVEKRFIPIDDSTHLSPYLVIFSPPPEA